MSIMDDISRTQKKKHSHSLQKLGERLVHLSNQQLGQLNLADELIEALIEARSLSSHGARRRQMQYIGSLMHHEDEAHLTQALDHLENQGQHEVRHFKQAESLRDKLVAGDATAMEQLITRYPQVAVTQLHRLVEACRTAKAEPLHRKANRELFRFLHQLMLNS